MGFNTNKNSTDKNQFVATLNSRKSDKPTAWVNLLDSFVIKIFNAKTSKELTAKQVEEKLSKYYSNEFVYLVVKDTTAEIETVDVSEF